MKNLNRSTEHTVPALGDLQQATQNLCDKAMDDAKAQLHPLLRNAETRQLDRRVEFMRAFKLALEQRVAQRMAAWQPTIRAIFQFDECWVETRSSWDGSIHLLVKVPRLLKTVKILGKRLDLRNFPKKLIFLGLINKLNEKRNIGPHRAPFLYSFNKKNYTKALELGVTLS